MVGWSKTMCVISTLASSFQAKTNVRMLFCRVGKDKVAESHLIEENRVHQNH